MHRKVDIADVRRWLDDYEPRPPRSPDIPYPEELASLLSQLAVTHQFPDMRQGHFWCVYAQCHPGAIANSFDVLVHVFAAKSEPSPDCQGLKVALREQDGIYWLTQGSVDHHGQIWFRNVSPGCYHVVPNRFQLHAHSQGTACTRVAAASTPEEDLLIFYLEDRRVRVDVMRLSESGKTELTVSTQAEALANAKVEFVLGDMSGMVLLLPTGVKGYYRGTRKLELAFSDACRYVPHFSITAPEKEGR